MSAHLASWGWLAVAFLFAGAGTANAQTAPPSLRTQVAPVGDFTLTERSGQEFSPRQLQGKVWVAHFFYTTCPGPCVKTLPTMRKLQETFRGKPDVALVSITVKPAHDTIEQLQRYADDQQADPTQWLFLTGEETAVHKIVREAFFQAVAKETSPRTPEEDVTHSPTLLVVDREGMILGFLDGTRPESAELLASRVREVAGARYRLPAINAVLNTLCTLLLVAGYAAIYRRNIAAHKACMLAALFISAVFLANYLYFHFVVTEAKPTLFRGVGPVRWAYFAILISHTLLAIVVAPLALYVTVLGLRDRLTRHVLLARWTLPIWLYVTVTGVVVYLMLYQLYPPY